jgi:hypothetical protein
MAGQAWCQATTSKTVELLVMIRLLFRGTSIEVMDVGLTVLRETIFRIRNLVTWYIWEMDIVSESCV